MGGSRHDSRFWESTPSYYLYVVRARSQADAQEISMVFAWSIDGRCAIRTIPRATVENLLFETTRQAVSGC